MCARLGFGVRPNFTAQAFHCFPRFHQECLPRRCDSHRIYPPAVRSTTEAWPPLRDLRQQVHLGLRVRLLLAQQFAVRPGATRQFVPASRRPPPRPRPSPRCGRSCEVSKADGRRRSPCGRASGGRAPPGSACSLSLSSALVASSSSRIGAFFSSARAIASRCRCPPESLHAAVADHRVEALRQRLDEVAAARDRGGREHLVLASRRAVRSGCSPAPSGGTGRYPAAPPRPCRAGSAG